MGRNKLEATADGKDGEGKNGCHGGHSSEIYVIRALVVASKASEVFLKRLWNGFLETLPPLELRRGSDTAPFGHLIADNKVYHRLQVAVACKLADDDYFRPGMSRKMKVQPVKFEMHGEEYVPKKKGNRNKNSKEKAKVAEKVLGWAGFDDTLKPAQVTPALKIACHELKY